MGLGPSSSRPVAVRPRLGLGLLRRPGGCCRSPARCLAGFSALGWLAGCSPGSLPFYFKNTKNLFIHIALIPVGDNPRVNPNILKCLLNSPVAKGYRLVVIASRAIVCKTPTYYLILNSLAFARGCVILRSHILFPLLLILLISHHI